MFCPIYAQTVWDASSRVVDTNMVPPSQVFFSVLMGAMNMGQAAPFMEAFNVARGAAANVYLVLERHSLIDPSSPHGVKPEHTTGEIG